MWPFNASWWKRSSQPAQPSPLPQVEPGFVSPPAPPANLPEKPAGDGLAACQDLVRSVHLDCMRQHGLPREWLDCEVMLAPHQGKTSFAILFVVKKWSDELLQHLPAYESSFKFQLDMVSATLSQRVRVMAWRTDSGAGNPIKTMPAADYWSDAAIAQRHLRLKAQALELKLLHARTGRPDQSEAATDFQATRPMEQH